jgi:hypothetical protein
VQDAEVAGCSKNYYGDQKSARLALQSILEKKPRKATKMPKRVYPCDSCDGWHLTAKPNIGKTPAWERDPNWVRPAKELEGLTTGPPPASTSKRLSRRKRAQRRH